MKCNGIVTSKLMSIVIVEFGHADGTVCVRPYPDQPSLALGALVESEFQNDGLCEHRIIKVHNALIPEEKTLTVATSDLPSKEIIERAKIPPPIRHASYVPMRADVPIENLDQLAETKQAEIAKKLNAALTEVARDTVELNELNSMRGVADEPSAGPPVSPFSDEFNPRTAGPRRKSGKPVSPFDWK